MIYIKPKPELNDEEFARYCDEKERSGALLTKDEILREFYRVTRTLPEDHESPSWGPIFYLCVCIAIIFGFLSFFVFNA